MARVVLSQAFLSDASDPSDYISAYTSERSDTRSTPGEVRRQANGRLRVVTRAGSSTELGVTFRMLTPAQVAFVDGLRGRVVLFRDVHGRKMYGTFFKLRVRDYIDRAMQDVTVTLAEVSFSEAI